VIRLAFTVSPEVVYSPIVPVTPGLLPTNRADPDTATLHAIPTGSREAFTVSPEVVYSPMPFPATKMWSSPRAVAGRAEIAAATESIATAMTAKSERTGDRHDPRVRRNERMASPENSAYSGASDCRGSPSRLHLFTRYSLSIAKSHFQVTLHADSIRTARR